MGDDHRQHRDHRRRRRERHHACGHTNGHRTLRDCRCGERVIVVRIASDLPCATRLRELGILEGEAVVVLRPADPLVILAQDSRIAIDVGTADAIEVDGTVDD